MLKIPNKCADNILLKRIWVLTIALLGVGVFGCMKAKMRNKEIVEFEFSYSDTWSTSFSLKAATNQDTVYLRYYYFASEARKMAKWDKIELGQMYYAVLSGTEKLRLNTLLDDERLSLLDSSYYKENLSDGISYVFDLKKAGKLKSISFYGIESPQVLKGFIDSVLVLSENLRLFPIDTTISFRTAKGFDVNPAMEGVKFLPPDLER